jgi:two-component system sensor histidine kinase QseC
MHSLHARLFGTLLAMFVIAWTIVGICAGVQFARARSGSLDYGLDEVGRVILLSMPSDIGHLSGTSNLRLSNEAPVRLEKLGRLRFQVWSKSRHEIAVRSAGASSAPLKPDFADGFTTVNIGGEEWRVFAISDARNEVQVQVGKPTSELGAELKSWLYYALGVSLLALLVIGIAIKLVVRWSLQPVVTIQSAITSRDARDLAPLPDRGLPCEVRPLVDSFNRLLGRLEHTMQAERKFLTEAAHELRTPLAVLLTHAQVAQRARTLEEARASLDQLVRGVERSARLSQQLLDSARIDVERHAGEQAPVELADIVAVVTHEFEMMAAQKGQSIALDTESGAIRGNVNDLGILVRNLVDNALRYAGRDCRVAVRCERDANVVRFEVFDNGPGVAEDDRERIFDRFYRGAGTSERGSGIGLALVSRIAQSHGATISTGTGLDGRGFGISVSFRALEEVTIATEPAATADESAKDIELSQAPAPS